jgi:hypothetical protein
MFVLGGSANGVTIQNNLYIAPALAPGATQAAPVFVMEGDLGSFRSISNNVWAEGNPLPYAHGGMNYMWPNWSDSRGYLSAQEWNSRSQVGTDIFADVTMHGNTPSENSPAAHGGMHEDGVLFDFYGKKRPEDGSISVGAVEV